MLLASKRAAIGIGRVSSIDGNRSEEAICNELRRFSYFAFDVGRRAINVDSKWHGVPIQAVMLCRLERLRDHNVGLSETMFVRCLLSGVKVLFLLGGAILSTLYHLVNVIAAFGGRLEADPFR